jgi:putative restriction endonuclease
LNGFDAPSAKAKAVEVRTSHFLQIGRVYTREELRSAFKIVDSTINNGIFLPKGHQSIWLFATKDKTSDRVQYVDEFDGVRLKMESQALGRHDDKMAAHKELGLEVVLFYRDSKRQYPGAGFEFVGPMGFVARSASKPARFVFDTLKE